MHLRSLCITLLFDTGIDTFIAARHCVKTDKVEDDEPSRQEFLQVQLVR